MKDNDYNGLCRLLLEFGKTTAPQLEQHYRYTVEFGKHWEPKDPAAPFSDDYAYRIKQ